MRLVICDDHALLLEAMSMALADKGHEIVEAVTTPDQAVEASRRARPDVCLFDLTYPTGSGLPYIPHILAASPTTKVLIMSGDSNPVRVAEALSHGASGWIGKEEALEQFGGALDRVKAGQVALEPGLMRRAFTPTDPTLDPLWVLRFLTDREWQTLRCIVRGESTAEMAATLRVRRSTARTHVQNLLGKLGVHSRLQAAALVAAYLPPDGWPSGLL